MSASLTKLRILSFNILAEQFIDYSDLSVDYPGIRIRDLKEKNRLPKIMNYLVKTDADIMMLQEVNIKVLSILRTGFIDSYIIYPLAKHKADNYDQRGEVYGNLIMIKKGLASKGEYCFHRVPRLGTAFAILNCTVGNTKTLFVNIHLDSDVKEKNRRIEIDMLNKLLKPYMDTHSILISGDFNTSDSTTHKKFNNFTSVVKEHVGSYLNDAPMIDWIYVRNIIILDGKVPKPDRATAATPLKKFGSDHYPVLARIAIPTNLE